MDEIEEIVDFQTRGHQRAGICARLEAKSSVPIEAAAIRKNLHSWWDFSDRMGASEERIGFRRNEK